MVKVDGYVSKGGNLFMDGSYLPSDKGQVAPKGDNYFLVALPVVYSMPIIVPNMHQFQLYHLSPDFFQSSYTMIAIPSLNMRFAR